MSRSEIRLMQGATGCAYWLALGALLFVIAVVAVVVIVAIAL